MTVMKAFYPCLPLLLISFSLRAQNFSFEEVKSYPFPNELTSAATGSRIAWAVNEQGRRNVYVAEGPDFTARKLTAYDDDDGQEITSLQISADGQWVVYVRGGDHGANWDDENSINPGFAAMPLKVQVWAIPFKGGAPKSLGEGDLPKISPKGDAVAFLRNDQVWQSLMDSTEPAKNLFIARGKCLEIEWSPDGSQLAFVSARDDHNLIGIFSNRDLPIRWIAPDFSRDESPRWSRDGKKIAFVRMPGRGGAPDSLLARRHNPWAVMVADVAQGSAVEIWKAPATLRGSVPTTQGSFNLHFAAGERIIFLSYHDGWPHLYSISSSGGTPLLLTPGSYMAEYIQLSYDGKFLVFCGNTGPDPLDVDRRHVVRVPVDRVSPEVLTPGDGLEWTPVVTGDGNTIAMITATARRPPLVSVMPFASKNQPQLVGEGLIPKTFPQNLVTPKQVIYKSSDGMVVHAQLFEGAGKGKHPGIIFVHGGPPRQMLLGWHYSDYYTNAYAINQYLASRGFTVLSVNYRLGIGYGYEFHHPERAGQNGASEYLDVKAGAEWLSGQNQIDAGRVGIYGGSYGGYLTAMGLAHDSKLFAAGVDVHGVHDWSVRSFGDRAQDGFEKAPDAALALKTAWESSPVSAIGTWTSSVLLIHGDDDRNVRFSQTTDLLQRLEKKGVDTETLVIVDDTHHWMKHSNSLKAGNATAAYFMKKFMKK